MYVTELVRFSYFYVYDGNADFELNVAHLRMLYDPIVTELFTLMAIHL